MPGFHIEHLCNAEIYLGNKARSTIRHKFTKEKNSQTKGGERGPLGPPLNPPFLARNDYGRILVWVTGETFFPSTRQYLKFKVQQLLQRTKRPFLRKSEFAFF